MDKRLKAIRFQFNQMEAKKQEIMNLLEILPPHQFNQQPHTKSWSIAQVAGHLYLSERNSLAYLKKKLSYPDTVPKYHIKSWGGILLIKLVFFTGYKIKAPDSINMWKIQDDMTKDDLKMKWTELRHELITFIENNEPAFGRHLAFRHPFAGRMTMHQMLIFMNDHIEHHQKQMQRIINQINIDPHEN